MVADQPTINQTTSSMVDGVNLEEIKEFAKAFKMRRLGLGLTQTQVGQALSVTEGPAYSQSAICRCVVGNLGFYCYPGPCLLSVWFPLCCLFQICSLTFGTIVLFYYSCLLNVNDICKQIHIWMYLDYIITLF